MAEGNSAILRVGFVLFFLNVVNEVRVSEEKKKKIFVNFLVSRTFFLEPPLLLQVLILHLTA